MISPQTKLILLANPNHTGTILSSAEIKEILTFALDYQLIVLVDEAYFEFSDQTAISLISDFDNLFGALEFSVECINHGVQPIIGCNLLVKNSDFEKSLEIKKALFLSSFVPIK